MDYILRIKFSYSTLILFNSGSHHQSLVTALLESIDQMSTFAVTSVTLILPCLQ